MLFKSQSLDQCFSKARLKKREKINLIVNKQMPSMLDINDLSNESVILLRISSFEQQRNKTLVLCDFCLRQSKTTRKNVTIVATRCHTENVFVIIIVENVTAYSYKTTGCDNLMFFRALAAAKEFRQLIKIRELVRREFHLPSVVENR